MDIFKWPLLGQARWLMPAILATQEAEIWRITVIGQDGQKVSNTPISKTSWAWWRMPVT
jgi:hypothetical protein